jgi:hypothetical protein
MPPVATRKALSATVSFLAVLVTVAVTVWLLKQSWNSIDYTATATTNSSGVASFSTNATSSTGTYFQMLPYVDTSLTSYYYDSYQNKAWTTYFSVH